MTMKNDSSIMSLPPSGIKTSLPILSESTKSFSTKWYKGKEQALFLYQQWVRKGSIPIRAPLFKNCPHLFHQFLQHTSFDLPHIVKEEEAGGTCKLLLSLSDGEKIESVIIPMKSGLTLCLSSQVGCQMGCRFCQTAKMGLRRNLLAEEIVAQVFIAKQMKEKAIRNLVFMGMGEPFDNFEEVKKAILILTDPLGFSIPPKAITISTAGRIDGIEKMRAELDPKIRLALSLHGPTEEIRMKLMPITRKYSMGMLKESLIAFSERGKRKILIEYILIKEITDRLDDLPHLIDWLQGISCLVNLIPYNAHPGASFQRSDEERSELYKKRLQEAGIPTFLRTTRGDEIMAACGQLGAAQSRFGAIKKSLPLHTR